MDLAQLSDRAMEIRRRFAEREKSARGREWTREESVQGLVVDVGDLMRLVMAKAGARSVADVDRKLAPELSDCLWSVLVLARSYGLDLEREFLTTMLEPDGARRLGVRRAGRPRERSRPGLCLLAVEGWPPLRRMGQRANGCVQIDVTRVTSICTALESRLCDAGDCRPTGRGKDHDPPGLRRDARVVANAEADAAPPDQGREALRFS
jgi:NTP pyrophosphatase (non-canonical NTP hydrolase)